MDENYYRKKKPGRGLIRGSMYRIVTRGSLWKFGVLAVIVGYVLFGNRGVIQRLNLESAKGETKQRIEEARIDSVRLREDLKRVSEDNTFIEKIARERYGMIRSGESVYRITEE
jgi:cell division protein FtsB